VTVPSRRTLGRHLVDIERMLKDGMEAFFKGLGPSVFVSLSTDIWTSRAQDPYIGILVHFIDDDYLLHCVTVGVDFLPGSHDVESIRCVSI
jgi:hypothetical protein